MLTQGFSRNEALRAPLGCFIYLLCLCSARLEAPRAPLKQQHKQPSPRGNRRVNPAWKENGAHVYLALAFQHAFLRALDMLGICRDDD